MVCAQSHLHKDPGNSGFCNTASRPGLSSLNVRPSASNSCFDTVPRGHSSSGGSRKPSLPIIPQLHCVHPCPGGGRAGKGKSSSQPHALETPRVTAPTIHPQHSKQSGDDTEAHTKLSKGTSYHRRLCQCRQPCKRSENDLSNTVLGMFNELQEMMALGVSKA